MDSVEVITSTANPRIRQARKLRERKYRDETGRFLAEGLRIVGEALEQGAEIVELVTCQPLLDHPYGRTILQQAEKRRIPRLEVSREVFASLSNRDGPQGVAAVIRQAWTPLDQVSISSGRFWVALDAVADPGNLGSILRTTDAAGWVGAILLDKSTDPYDPTAVRASMGSLFSQQVARTTLAEFKAWLPGSQFALVGTSGASHTDYAAYNYPEPMILLMGSEREGLRPEHTSLCNAVVAIPMQGRSDSLNLAVSTGIIIYEIYNQRRKNHQPAHPAQEQASIGGPP